MCCSESIRKLTLMFNDFCSSRLRASQKTKMKYFVSLFVLSLYLLGNTTTATPLDNYYEEEPLDYESTALLSGMEENMDKDIGYEELALSYPVIQKRKSSTFKYRKSCVPRGGNCDHRPKYCCNSGSCRCNLWGANCKCQRMGFFQKWGK